MKPRAIYADETVKSVAVLKFAAISAQATEKHPLKLGNAEFWIGTGPWEGMLIHDPASNQWDKDAVQKDLDSYLADKLNGLHEYLKSIG